MSTKGKNLVKLLQKDLGPLGFAGFLRGARASKDLSQVEMARMLGISRSTLCDIEKGRHLVSASLAVEISVLAALQDQLNKANIRMKLVLVA